MDKQDLMVCFWMMFLRYLEGFWQKTKYNSCVADFVHTERLYSPRYISAKRHGFTQPLKWGHFGQIFSRV